MFDSLLNVLQWLLPTGSVGAVVVWLTSKTLRQAHTAKQVHDTYKAMYEDVRGTLILLQDDNTQLHEAILRLEATIRRATECRYYDTCPLRNELQHLKTNGGVLAARKRGSGGARGQPANRRDCAADDPPHLSTCAGGQPQDENTLDEPP